MLLKDYSNAARFASERRDKYLDIQFDSMGYKLFINSLGSILNN